MATVFERVGALLGRKSDARTVVSVEAGPKSADGSLGLANEGDGRYELVKLSDRLGATPERHSQYLYLQLAPELRDKLAERLVIEIEYYGKSSGTFRLQYSSTDRSAPYDGLYKEAEQFLDR